MSVPSAPLPAIAGLLGIVFSICSVVAQSAPDDDWPTRMRCSNTRCGS